MDYQSTRGPIFADEAEAILRGIAADGGLFVDPALGERPFDWSYALTLPAVDLQSMLLRHLLPGIPDMDELVGRAYAGKFETGDLTPLVEVGGAYFLELYRGPTAAFKDVALSMLPQLVAAAKKKRSDGGETVVLTATSGDTGKAALEGFHDVPGTRIFVFFPHGGVSAVQRAQMVTQEGGNVRSSRRGEKSSPPPTRSTSDGSPRSWCITSSPTRSCSRADASAPEIRSTTSCRRATSATSWRAGWPSASVCRSGGSSAPRTPTAC